MNNKKILELVNERITSFKTLIIKLENEVKEIETLTSFKLPDDIGKSIEDEFKNKMENND
jgi:hypothetical protein